MGSSKSKSATARGPSVAALHVENTKDASDWRFSTPVIRFYEDNFDVIKEKPLGEEFEEFDVGSTTCSIGVMIMRSEDEFVYATTGFGNMVLLEEKEQGIPREKRNHGFELVFRLPIPEEQKNAGSNMVLPAWPVDLLLRICAEKVDDPMPPVEPTQRVLINQEQIPESHEQFDQITTRHFFYALADKEEDAPFNRTLEDAHGKVRFLFLCGLTAQERFWAKNHGLSALETKMREVSAACNEAADDAEDTEASFTFGLNDLYRESVVQRRTIFRSVRLNKASEVQ
ncbi:Hypothetical Protein FCC1311_091352 [Hondaea fermentalgiana]|uniref:Suppressor of fused-like domain-containing protein n=1 Tax=Hondaea fermentalgiana TaxID=2315210 RepID=A0A2R5GRH5_9STRA|nr:Hypothetical Protein FCC1311_091352 [Hondaea fermentalgiana]|eukprot:GBG32909.1 Hypothetical Protein FCC1311_091352 [Hondaea fermentalgiana]